MQLDDDHCGAQFDLADDKKKELIRAEGKLTTSITDAKERVDCLPAHIVLEHGVKVRVIYPVRCKNSSLIATATQKQPVE